MHTTTTADRILEAAAELWHEGGFEAVTTRAVANRAGVNEVTLFRHFASKEGLLKAMVGRAVADCSPTDDAPLEPSSDIEHDLVRWARGYLDRTLPVGDLILLGLVEARGRPDLAAACLQAPSHLQTALTARLHALCDMGRLPPGPFEDIAAAFYATLFAHVLTAHLRPSDTDLLAERVARVFSRALRHDDDAAPPGSPGCTAGGRPFAP